MAEVIANNPVGDPIPQGLTSNQATEAFANMFGEAEPETDAGIAEDEAPVEDNLEDEQDADAEELESEDEDESEDDEDADSEEEGEYFEIEGERFSTEEIIEFKNSGLRQADYTKKTQELSEQRKEVTGQLEQFTQLNEQYVQALENAQYMLAAQMNMDGQTEEALQRLRTEDFDEYLRVKDQVDQRKQQLHQYFSQVDQARQQQAAANEQIRAQRMQEAATQIATAIPDYADAEKGPELRKGVSDMLGEFGFTMEDLNGIEDHRMFMVAHALYQERSSSPEKKKAVAKKKAAKKVAPVLRGGQQKTKSQRQSKRVQDLRNNALESGTQANAAKFFETIL